MAKYSKEFEHTRRKLIKETINFYDYFEKVLIESADDIDALVSDPIDVSTEMMVEILRAPEVKSWMRAYSSWISAVAERAMEE